MKPRMADLVAQAARHNGMQPGEVYQRTRRHNISHVRQQAMYFCCKAGYSLPQVARHFECHHTTVLHARRAVERRLAGQGGVSRETNSRETDQ